MDEARVRMSGRRQFVSTDASGRCVVMDVPPAYLGGGEGIRPLELFLHALGGCTAMDVISILEKKRQDVRDIEVIVRGEQRLEEYPRIYTRIEIEYVITGFDVQPDAVQRAIELSEEKYCTVRGMLGPQVTVETTFRVEESPRPGYAVLDAESDE